MSHIDQSLDDDRCDCRHVRAMLPSMATLVALGRTCEDEYRQEYQHIASCSACQAEYNDVCSMTAEIYADDVPVVSDDIRAIRSRATLSSYSFWFSQALLTALNQPTAFGAVRGSVYRHNEHWVERNVHIAIEIFDSVHASECSLRVRVERADYAVFDQPKTVIVIETPSRSWHAQVDSSGYAHFSHIPLSVLPELLVKVALHHG